MYTLSLHPPRIQGQEVTFSWDLDPASHRYRQNSFYFRFPPDVDLQSVPKRVWWNVFLICAHTQWLFHRPIEVRLPIVLDPGEAQIWMRLLACHGDTLDYYLPVSEGRGAVRIVEGDRELPPYRARDAGRCAAAFSGGKDSLTQTGLLREMVDDLLLVTITAPRIAGDEYSNPRRESILGQIRTLPGLRLVDVETNLRSIMVGMQMYTDTLLYTGALLAAAAADGATHLFLAAENELAANATIDGRYVQMRHFMYSPLTQRTLHTLLQRQGFSYGSLTVAMHSYQVQTLLIRRYPKLKTLQFSCWLAQEPDPACSVCEECARLACVILSLGESPTSMGVDVIKMFDSLSEWSPRVWKPSPQRLPNREVSERLFATRISALNAISPYHVLLELQQRCGGRTLSPDAWKAWGQYRRIRRLTRALHYELPGYRSRFLELIDPLVRERLSDILREHFEAEPEHCYTESYERLVREIDRVTEPGTRPGA